MCAELQSLSLLGFVLQSKLQIISVSKLGFGLNMCIITSYFIFIAFSVFLLYHFNFYVFLQFGSLLYTHFSSLFLSTVTFFYVLFPTYLSHSVWLLQGLKCLQDCFFDGKFFLFIQLEQNYCQTLKQSSSSPPPPTTVDYLKKFVHLKRLQFLLMK